MYIKKKFDEVTKSEHFLTLKVQLICTSNFNKITAMNLKLLPNGHKLSVHSLMYFLKILGF